MIVKENVTLTLCESCFKKTGMLISVNGKNVCEKCFAKIKIAEAKKREEIHEEIDLEAQNKKIILTRKSKNNYMTTKEVCSFFAITPHTLRTVLLEPGLLKPKDKRGHSFVFDKNEVLSCKSIIEKRIKWKEE